MKKTISIILALALLIGGVFCLSSCGAKYEYDNSDKYVPGPFESSLLISELDIVWPYGKVEITYHPYWYISCGEIYDGAIGSEYEMHTYYDGTALNIKAAANGASYDSIPEKTLVIGVPSNSFNRISIETDKASVSISDCNANYADISTVSGDVDISFIASSQRLEIETESGNINASASVINRINISSDGGDITVANTRVPASTEIETDNGNIKLTLPEDAAFAAELKSGAGVITNDFKGTEQNGKLIVNGGTSPVKLEADLGRVTIKKQ